MIANYTNSFHKNLSLTDIKYYENINKDLKICSYFKNNKKSKGEENSKPCENLTGDTGHLQEAIHSL